MWGGLHAFLSVWNGWAIRAPDACIASLLSLPHAALSSCSHLPHSRSHQHHCHSQTRAELSSAARRAEGRALAATEQLADSERAAARARADQSVRAAMLQEDLEEMRHQFARLQVSRIGSTRMYMLGG